MDRWQLLKWRKNLGYTQEEAAEKLGIARGTISSWERGTIAIPPSIELATCELTRRWKQRPDFGPVNVIYANAHRAAHRPLIRCELYSNNDAAIRRVLDLTQNVMSPMIVEDGGVVVWTAWELLRELEKRRDELAQPQPVRRGRRSRSARPDSVQD